MNTNASPRKKYLRIILLALMGCGVSTLLGFVVYRQNHAVCKRVEIQLEDAGELKMFTQEDVAKWVSEVGGDLISKRLDSIPLEVIRRRLLSESAVHSSDVYTTIDGRCVVKVKQRIPVMRILENSGSSYYLDNEGYPISLGDDFFRLPLYTGHISGSTYFQSVRVANNKLLSELLELNSAITQSEFWSGQFEHATIGQYGEIVMIPRVGNQRIMFGMYGDYRDQLRRVKSFYDHIIEKGDLNRYAAIDARFRGQIVGIKN